MIVAWFRDCIYGNRSGTEGLEEQEMKIEGKEYNIKSNFQLFHLSFDLKFVASLVVQNILIYMELNIQHFT